MPVSKKKIIALFIMVLGCCALFPLHTREARGQSPGISVPGSGRLHLNGATFLAPGDVTNAGTIQSTSGTFSIQGNWVNTGTFLPGSGSVVLRQGTHTVSGSNNFYNFTYNATGGGLTFEAGKTQTIANTLTLKGAAGSYLALRSSSGGSSWTLNPQGTIDVDYVDVKDSNNTGSRISPTNWTDSGNNSGWGASSPPPPPSGGVTYITVSSTNPSTDASGVTVNTAVSATFSDTINGSTLTSDTFKLSGGGSSVSGSVSANGATATFTPSSNLSYSTTYTVLITTGVKAANSAGSTLSTDYSWSFTTQAAPATATPTPQGSPSVTPASTATPVQTVSPSPSPKATPTPKITPSPIPTVSPIASPSPTLFPTPTPRLTPSPSPTPKTSPTLTPSPTPKITPSPIPTASPLPTPAPSPQIFLSKNIAYLNGDTVVVTVEDAAANTGRDKQETLNMALKVKGAGGDEKTLHLDLIESARDSGKFLATVKTDALTSGGASTSGRANIGVIKAVQDGSALVTYTNMTTSHESEEELWFSSFDARLKFSANVYSIGEHAVVTLTDAEENGDAKKSDKVDTVFASTSSANQARIKMVETGTDTGIFMGSILLNSKSTADNDRIKVEAGKTLRVSYEDKITTSGSPKTVSARCRVSASPAPNQTPSPAATPRITPSLPPVPQTTPLPPSHIILSKRIAYLSGDTVVVTVEDSDSNTDQGRKETLNKAIKVQRTDISGASPLVLDLKETSGNSGTFLATIKTGTVTSGGVSSLDRSNIGVMKADQDGTAVVIYTSTKTSGKSQEALWFSSSDARLKFSADVYSIGGHAVITLTDAEQNGDAEKADKVDTVFASTSSSNQSKVKMVETGTDTGIFIGSLMLSSFGTLDKERIHVEAGKTMKVSYEDKITTTGHSNTVTDECRVVASPIPGKTPTPVSSPSPQQTPGPTPAGCEAAEMVVSPSGRVEIEVGVTKAASVTLKGEGGCIPEGKRVTAGVEQRKTFISVASDNGGVTDAEGIARFTVAAIKGGLAYITFETDGIKKKLRVRAAGRTTTTPTPAGSPSPAPTPAGCAAADMAVSLSDSVEITVGTTKTAAVTLVGEGGCIPEGIEVTAGVEQRKTFISVAPDNGGFTDAEGIARFTVTAIKGGLAYITFEADGVEKKITVMVTD